MHSPGDVWCNGDRGITSNVPRLHRHAALSVRSCWKEQKNERVTAAAERLISQPNSPEEGLFKFGSVQRVLSYTQTADEELRDGFLLCQAILVAASVVKRPFSYDAHVSFFKNVKEKKKVFCLTSWCVTQGCKNVLWFISSNRFFWYQMALRTQRFHLQGTQTRLSHCK